MRSCRESNFEWFDAAIEGDINFLQPNIQYCKNSLEDRSSDLNPKILSSFSALMYAIYYNRQEAVELLFPYEYMQVTKTPTRIYSQSTRQTVLLPLGSNIYHVVLLTENSQILNFLSEKLKDAFYAKFFIMKTNSFRQTISHYAFLNYSFSAATICYYDELFENEFYLLDKTNSTPLMLASYIGKHVYVTKARNYLQNVFEPSSEEYDLLFFKRICKNIFRKNSMGMDIFEVCELEVDENIKGEIEYGSKGKCAEILKEILLWYESVKDERETKFEPVQDNLPSATQEYNSYSHRPFNAEQSQMQSTQSLMQEPMQESTAENLSYRPYEMQNPPVQDEPAMNETNYKTKSKLFMKMSERRQLKEEPEQEMIALPQAESGQSEFGLSTTELTSTLE